MLLLEHEPNNNYNQTPPQCPSAAGTMYDIVPLPEHKTKVNSRYASGRIALMWAAWSGHKDMFNMLAAAAQVAHQRNFKFQLQHKINGNASVILGQMPLQCAFPVMEISLVKQPLETGDTEANLKDNDGRTTPWIVLV
ncbi:hypothetical protein BP5796_12198 [Coleophoma crateriformis]|uniref:Uncharacterized protein n=1 Tax=Coleophoma crateriformis TaxID=565419 RepID=A0A3D8Q9G7_9HELO|nr:hypothetical protein BP5796_12198 [Coleophoma crateriformis]